MIIMRFINKDVCGKIFQKCFRNIRKIIKIRQSTLNNQDFKEIVKIIMDKNIIICKKVYINIELGHTYDLIQSTQRAMDHYETAANIASQHPLVAQELVHV